MKTKLVYFSAAVLLASSFGALFTLIINLNSISASPLSVPAPTLMAIPAEAYNYKPTDITITGTSFFATTGTSVLLPQVTLNQVRLSNVTLISNTMLTVTVSADLPGGVYTLTVTNPDSQSVSSPNAFTVLMSGDGTLTPWQSTTSMTAMRVWPAAAQAGNYLYALGGSNPVALNSVERTSINSDGSLGPWQITTPMNSARATFAAVYYNGYLYALGDGNSVEWVMVNADGSLGSWQYALPMSTGRSGLAAIATNGFIYAIGGGYTDSVERAAINAEGSLGSWQAMSSMNTQRGYLAAVAVGNHVYAIGGQNPSSASLRTVERAVINPDGTLGDWQFVNSMNMPRCNLAAVMAQGYIYAIGGGTCSGLIYDSTERAQVNADGSLGPWEIVPSMTILRHRLAAAQAGRYIYAIGGEDDALSPLNSVERATVSPPLLTDFSPSAVTSDQGTIVAVSGKNFLPPPSLRLGDSITLTTASGSLTALTATVPGDLVIGWYTATLTSGDGRTATLTNAVRVDGPGPVAVGDYGLTINDGALFTNKITVTLTIGSRNDTALMQISNDGSFAGVSWETYTSHKAWTITQYGNYVIPRVVYVRYKDVNGNNSATFQDDIILDVTAPSGSVEIVPGVSQRGLQAVDMEAMVMQPVITRASNNYSYTVYLPLALNDFFCPPTGAANVTLHLSAQDDVSGVANMMISNLASFNCATWEPYATTKAWYMPQGTTTTVYVRFRDNAGNISETVTDTVAALSQYR